MRFFLLLLLIFLGMLTLLASLIKPRPSVDGRIPLIWASSANPYRTNQIERFNELYPHILLRQDSSNNRFEKNIVQLSSGVGPDLYDAISGTSLQAYVETGVALDITTIASANHLAAGINTWPAIVNEITLSGRQYGYPANVSVQVCLYNKNVFDRFGVPYPTGKLTWDEFFTLLKKVSGVHPGGGEPIEGLSAMDYSGRSPSAVLWQIVFQSLRGEFFTPDGTTLTINTSDLRTAFEYHRDAIFLHRIHPASAAMGSMTGSGAWGGGAIAQFAEGKFATIFTGKFALASLREFVAHQKEQLRRWNSDPSKRQSPKPEVLRIGAIVLPRFIDRKPGAIATAQTVVVNPQSPHRDAALEFLRFLASDAYARMVMPYGLPADPEKVTYDFPISYEELGEYEVTRCVVASLEHGYQIKKSPFLLEFDIQRILTQQIARLEANPRMDITGLLAEAETELNAMLQMNLQRDPQLAALYNERLETATGYQTH